MKSFGTIALLAAALALANIVAPQAAAQSAPSREYDVKAALLFKFAQFVAWPPTAFPNDGAPVVLATVGDDPFHGVLDTIVTGKTISGRPILIRHFSLDDPIQRCHILFISRAQADQQQSIISRVNRSPILTVGETDNFCQAGGIIQFLYEDEKIHFEVNTDAADQAAVKISSRLLNLAKIYKP